MYIIEFLIVVAVVLGILLYGAFLLSPLLSVVLAVALGIWLFKIEAHGGLAIIGSTYGLLTIATIGARLAF